VNDITTMNNDVTILRATVICKGSAHATHNCHLKVACFTDTADMVID
jgi:hypothetical protein